MRLISLAALAVGWHWGCCCPIAAQADDLPTPATRVVDFAGDIQPLFRAHCYKCHGTEKQESGLRLHAKARAMAGGDNGPAIRPGKSAESPLVLRIAGVGDDARMPPEDDEDDGGKPLTAEQIGLIRAWIDQGAVWPDSADEGGKSPATSHWAYRKPVRSAPPRVQHAAAARSPIDSFVLARLEKEKLPPAAEEGRAKLIRRASLDIVGLPPTVDEVDEFLKDESPDAYERLIDRLLASPRYGERWGGLWLDRARYADTQGYEKDNRRTIWRYRDWVIAALNRNLPFDQFTIEQLSGDLLPDATLDQRIATAFHRNTMTNTEGGTDNEEFRVAAVVDRVSTTWEVWMATSFNCCQCHSHKYDPFTQREYYQFMAFFNSTEDADNDDEKPVLATPTAEDTRRIADLQRRVADAERQAAGPRAPEPAPGSPQEARDELANLKKQLAASGPTTTPIMRDLPPGKRRDTHLFVRGNFLDKGEKVTPGIPAVMHPMNPQSAATGSRLEIARWIVHPDNPLTGRVAANRLWETLFGVGIVETSENFGTQGELPTHPELLDWLATEYIRLGWDSKRMLRGMVTSATYRQSSAVTPALAASDPYNRLLARGPRTRLSAEQVRDQALVVAGLLSPKMFGPSVMPPQPDGVWQIVYSGDQWVSPTGDDRYRRGLYTFWRRTSPYPSMVAFDAPTREYCVVRRSRTNTPLQALVTLNDPAYVEAAQALARRVLRDGGADARSRAAFAFRTTLARSPNAKEIDRVVTTYERELAHFRADAVAAKALATSVPLGPPPGAMDPAELAAWTVVANVLLNLDETVTKG